MKFINNSNTLIDFSYYLNNYKYYPWGVLLASASKNNLLYTARELDLDTGLQFNRMRYYSPNLGRFSQKDIVYLYPNNYIYVENKPVIYIDPFGLRIVAPCNWHCYIACYTGCYIGCRLAGGKKDECKKYLPKT